MRQLSRLGSGLAPRSPTSSRPFSGHPAMATGGSTSTFGIIRRSDREKGRLSDFGIRRLSGLIVDEHEAAADFSCAHILSTGPKHDPSIDPASNLAAEVRAARSKTRQDLSPRCFGQLEHLAITTLALTNPIIVPVDRTHRFPGDAAVELEVNAHFRICATQRVAYTLDHLAPLSLPLHAPILAPCVFPFPADGWWTNTSARPSPLRSPGRGYVDTARERACLRRGILGAFAGATLLCAQCRFPHAQPATC